MEKNLQEILEEIIISFIVPCIHKSLGIVLWFLWSFLVLFGSELHEFLVRELHELLCELFHLDPFVVVDESG